jgi:hypothetical protein
MRVVRTRSTTNMGTSTYSIPVKFAAPIESDWIGKPVEAEGPSYHEAREAAAKLLGLPVDKVDAYPVQRPKKGIFGVGSKVARVSAVPRPFDFDEDTVGTILNGWLHKSDADEVGTKYRSCYVHTLTKGKMTVHAINEAEYSNGGEVALTAFSDDKEALKEFLEDFKLKATIQKDTTVQQRL